MGTFKAYLKKEILESIRNYRYLVLAIGILFFALMEPIMMKLLPELLKGQPNAEALAKLLVTSREAVLRNYIKDMFQFGAIFVIFTMSGMLSDERRTQKFVFPFAKGASQASIVLAKLLHYITVVVLLTMLGVFINCFYASMLIEGVDIPIKTVLFVGIMLSVYFTFNMVLATFFSAFLNKGISAGFVTLILGYFFNLLGNVDSIREWLPSALLTNANALRMVDSTKTLVACVICIAILVYTTIWKMKRTEVV